MGSTEWYRVVNQMANVSGNARLKILEEHPEIKPVLQYAYDPFKKFYMTGPSCHPGGGISGMGTIAAREILRDMGGIDDDDDFDF